MSAQRGKETDKYV